MRTWNERLWGGHEEGEETKVEAESWRQEFVNFYRGAIESFLTGNISNRHGSCEPGTGRLYGG